MNAGNMTARHLEWVANELDEWCAPLRLSLEPSSVTSFYVDLGAARACGGARPRRSRDACCSSTRARCTRC